MSLRSRLPPAVKRLARAVVPPQDWIVKHLICKIPQASPRMACYALSGVDFEDRATAVIMLGSEITAPGGLHIGSGSAIGRRCIIDARGEITIGRNVNISSLARLQTAKHLVDDPDFDFDYSPIVVGDRAWIAEGAVVLGGVTIGEGVVVATGAVVTKDVDPFTIVGGVPARPIGERSRELRYETPWRPDWM